MIDITLMLTLLLALLAVGTLGVAWQAWRSRERQKLLRDLLDGADAVEQRLHECRDQMAQLRAMVAALPGTLGDQVLPRLDPQASVQAALKDVLAHRLWIARNGESAPLEALASARGALRRSHDQLAEQLEKLRSAGDELREASTRHEAVVERSQCAQKYRLH